MKHLIKAYYKEPSVDRGILTNLLEGQKEKKGTFRITNIISFCLIILVILSFFQHFISLNISYMDVNSSLLSTIPLPLFFIMNICIVLVHFIYQNIVFLLLIGTLYFILHFESSIRRY